MTQPEATLLTSRELAEFVSAGFLRFDGVVPGELNKAAIEQFTAGLPPVGPGLPLVDAYRPGTVIGDILALPRIDGAITSLLGPGPVTDHHWVHARERGEQAVQRLHSDAMIDLRRESFDIQLMYYPAEVLATSGGTLLIPGSHLRVTNEMDIARYQNLSGQVRLSCPAGTILVLHHGLWHCGTRNHSDTVRFMLRMRLNPTAPQLRTWDTSDLGDPEIGDILGRAYRWFEKADARLELANRVRLWRVLTSQPDYDIGRWLTRIEPVRGGQ